MDTVPLPCWGRGRPPVVPFHRVHPLPRCQGLPRLRRHSIQPRAPALRSLSLSRESESSPQHYKKGSNIKIYLMKERGGGRSHPPPCVFIGPHAQTRPDIYHPCLGQWAPKRVRNVGLVLAPHPSPRGRRIGYRGPRRVETGEGGPWG